MTDRRSLAQLTRDPGPTVRATAARYRAPLAVGATFTVGRLAYATGGAVLQSRLRGDPPPSLRPEAVTFRWSEDARPTDVRLGPPATAVPLAGVFGPLIESVRGVALVARRALWGMVADGIGAAACAIGPDALNVADELIDGISPPCHTRPTWLVEDGVGLSQLRGTCCLAHLAPGHARCASCPSHPPAYSVSAPRRHQQSLASDPSTRS